MRKHTNTESASREATQGQFNGRPGAIQAGIDVHQRFYVVVVQEGGGNPKPAQRMAKEVFLGWASKLRRLHRLTAIHAVYEACGFGFGLQRQLTALGIACQVVCPQKLDERNQRVKTDGRDAKALCLKLDRFVEGNQEALARVRVPREKEEQLGAVHRQREQLVRTRKQLEAQGRSLMVDQWIEPVQKWWRARTFAGLEVPSWLKRLLSHTQPLLLALEEQIRALACELEKSAAPGQPRGLGALTSVVIDREVGDWHRFKNRRQTGSYTWATPGRILQRADPGPRLRDKARQPAAAGRAGRDRLAPGPLPASIPRGREMAPLVRQRALWPPARRERKRSWRWPASSRSTSGASAPAGSAQRFSD